MMNGKIFKKTLNRAFYRLTVNNEADKKSADVKNTIHNKMSNNDFESVKPERIFAGNVAVLVLRQADFGIKTSQGLLSIMGIYAILIAGPRLSNRVPPFAAFLINTVSIMLLMIMGCHNVIMYNHLTFVLGNLYDYLL